VIGCAIGLVFTVLAFERVQSLRDDHTAWGDAAEKIDLKAPANAVGRWRPFLNLGAYHLDRGSLGEAQRSFATAEALGSLHGSARFNQGVALQQQKKHAQALTTFAEAEKQGFRDLPLHYHRGESAFALGQFALAFDSFSQGLTSVAEGVTGKEMDRMREAMRMRRAEAAIGAGRYDDAIGDFNALLKASPQNRRLALGLGMALVVVLMVFGLASLASYWMHALRTPTPLFAPALFGVRSLRVGLLGNLFTRFGSGAAPFSLARKASSIAKVSQPSGDRRTISTSPVMVLSSFPRL